MDWEEYGEWILNDLLFLKDEGIPVEKYHKLFHVLHFTQFTWSIQKDQNRAIDGIHLRRKSGYDVQDGCNAPCSVLEMLAALAVRIDDEYIGDMDERHPGVIFWEMVCNLGLNLFPDRKYMTEQVDIILDRWMDRRFAADGYGSIFPLRHKPRNNMVNVEIWSQMLAYISENYT